MNKSYCETIGKGELKDGKPTVTFKLSEPFTTKWGEGANSKTKIFNQVSLTAREMLSICNQENTHPDDRQRLELAISVLRTKPSAKPA